MGNDMTTGGMRELHLFAGAGGGILGGVLLGHTPVCAVELEKYPRAVLLQRQRDGILPWFPIWDDVCTFDGTPWRGRVDVICGGFPCQDISSAGKGAGITGARSGLWSEFARIIREVGPRYVFVENSPNLTSRGLHVVLGDLAELGFDAEWCVLGADDAGYHHVRKRFWLLADSKRSRREKLVCSNKNSIGAKWGREAGTINSPTERISLIEKGLGQPGVLGVNDGLAYRVDRLTAIGNGQVPAVAAIAFSILWERLHNG